MARIKSSNKVGTLWVHHALSIRKWGCDKASRKGGFPLKHVHAHDRGRNTFESHECKKLLGSENVLELSNSVHSNALLTPWRQKQQKA